MNNYQVVYKVNDVERIVFAGKTDLTPKELIKNLDFRVSDELNTLPIEHFIYEPVKVENNESKK